MINPHYIPPFMQTALRVYRQGAHEPAVALVFSNFVTLKAVGAYEMIDAVIEKIDIDTLPEVLVVAVLTANFLPDDRIRAARVSFYLAAVSKGYNVQNLA